MWCSRGGTAHQLLPIGGAMIKRQFLISFSGATLGFGFNVWFQEELEYACPEGNTSSKNAK